MHLNARASHPLHQASAARELLGDDHPLVRLLARRDNVYQQLVAIAAVVSASLAALVDGVSAARWLLVASCLAFALLALVLVMLAMATRDEALDLIAAGEDALPLDAIERARRRLLRPRHRQELVRWLDWLRAEAARPARTVRPVRPLFRPSVIAGVAGDLEQIADQLRRRRQPMLRGTALLERLLCDGSSCLYGDDVQRLREELSRVRFLLSR